MKIATLLLVAVLAPGLLASSMAEAQVSNNAGNAAPARLAPAELVGLLRAGGYTIYFRHGATEPNPNEARAPADTDCSRQRNLSAAGREQVRRIGGAIRALGIPIGAVSAGPLCRTMETARLIFGDARPDPEIRGGGLGRADYPGLRRVISIPVPAGSNVAVIGHGHQFRLVSGDKKELEEGEAAIIRGLGDGRFDVIARIPSEQWERLKPLALETRHSPS